MVFGVCSFELFEASLTSFAGYRLKVVTDGVALRLPRRVMLACPSLLSWNAFESCEAWLAHRIDHRAAARCRTRA